MRQSFSLININYFIYIQFTEYFFLSLARSTDKKYPYKITITWDNTTSI